MPTNKPKKNVPTLDDMLEKPKAKKQKEGTLNNLGQILLEKGMTQQELADLTELFPSHISEIISGRRKGVHINIAIKIANALDMPVEDIFYNE